MVDLLRGAVYVVIRRGAYRHEILGCYSSAEKAIEAGSAAVLVEHDHYHDAEIVRLELDMPGETCLGAVEAVSAGRADGSLAWVAVYRKDKRYVR